LYGHETWFLTLREEHRLRVFEKRVLRRTFEPEWEEVAGGCRILRNGILCNLCVSPNIIKVIRSRRIWWVGCVTRMGERRNAYKILVGQPEELRPCGRPRLRWVDNIGMNLRGIG